MKLYKTDLVRKLSAKNRRTQAHYNDAIEEVFTAIGEQVANGHSVAILGFGTFFNRPRKEQRLKDVRSGKLVTVPAHHQVGFRPGDRLRAAVRTPNKTCDRLKA